MSTLTQEEYVKKPKANCCPVKNCQSDDVEGGTVSIIEKSAFQDVTCNTCGATWNDEYRLHNFQIENG